MRCTAADAHTHTRTHLTHGTRTHPEYADGSPVFVQKVRSLQRCYRALRRVRGDGNCFPRAFAFALMEGIVRTGDLAERNRCVLCVCFVCACVCVGVGRGRLC